MDSEGPKPFKGPMQRGYWNRCSLDFPLYEVKSKMKQCKRCKIQKAFKMFKLTYIKSVGKYYFRSYCRPCLNKINLIRKKKKPDFKAKENARSLRYYHAHKVLK